MDPGTGPLTFEVAWYGALVNQETKKPETKRNDISKLNDVMVKEGISMETPTIMGSIEIS